MLVVAYLASVDFLLKDMTKAYKDELYLSLAKLDPQQREEVLINLTGIDLKDLDGVRDATPLNRFLLLVHSSDQLIQRIEFLNMQLLAQIDTPRAWQRILTAGFEHVEAMDLREIQGSPTAELARFLFLNGDVGTRQNKEAGLALVVTEATLFENHPSSMSDGRRVRRHFRSIANEMFLLVRDGVEYDNEKEVIPKDFEFADERLFDLLRRKSHVSGGRCAIF